MNSEEFGYTSRAAFTDFCSSPNFSLVFLSPSELCYKLENVAPNYVPEKLIFELLHCIYSQGENIHLVVHKQSKYDLSYYIVNSSNILVQCCLPFLLENGYNLDPYEEARTSTSFLLELHLEFL